MLIDWVRAAVVLGAALLVAIPAAPAAADVAPSGAYTTSVSVEVPAFYGLEPAVSLTYSSSGGTDLAGFGWHVVAGSRIERVEEDVFEVDGLRLLPCRSTNSASCASGGNYAFAGETFLRVNFDSDANTWLITQRDGTVRTYLPALEGTWMLVNVRSMTGQVVRYDRWCDGNLECYVSRIRYGEGKACAGDGQDVPPGGPVAGGSVEFHWEQRPDEIESGVAGDRRSMRYRLASIDVQHGLKRLRTYELQYAPTATGQSSTLTRIDQYGEDAVLTSAGRVQSGTRAPARTFTTEANPAAFSGPSPTPGGDTIDLTSIGATNIAQTWPNVEIPAGISLRTADFDGDRRPDVMTWTVDDTCQTLTINLRLAGASTVTTSQVSMPPLMDGQGSCLLEVHAVDLDGDGRADLLFDHSYSVLDPNLNAYTRELVSILRVPDGGWRALPAAFPTDVLAQPGIVPAPCALGDIDGDGRTDYVCESVNNVLVVSRARLDGSFTHYPISRPSLTYLHHFALFDVDGDGRDDFVFAEHHTEDVPGRCAAPQYCGHWGIRVGVNAVSGPVWELQETTEFSTFGPDYQRTQLVPGDYDGDGRRDFVLSTINRDGQGAGIVLVLNRPQGGNRWQVSDQSVAKLSGMVSSGDINNDGADDLFITEGHGPHPAGGCLQQADHVHHLLVYAYSTRSGFTFPADPSDPCTGLDVPDPAGEVEYMDNGLGARGVDVNADGTADWMLATLGTSGWRIFDVPANNAGPAFGSLRPGDLDGDGRTDWVAVGFLNQGIEVIALHTEADGSVRQYRSAFASTLFNEAIEPHRVQTWFFTDVGSVGGGPDGHDDIVVIDPESRVVTTLLSTGSGGWERRTDFHQLPLSREMPVWRTLDLDGDGDHDLVQLYYLEVNGVPTLRASTLRAIGAGSWEAGNGDYFAGVSDDRSIAQYQVGDVDGDGRDDLIHVSDVPWGFNGLNTRINVLRSRGDGRFDPISSWVHQGRDDRRRYVPVDLDGDGRTDLAMATADGLVHSLLSKGDGSFEYRAVPHGLASALTAWGTFELADVDRDGRADLVHMQVTATGELAVTLGWNRGTTFARQDLPLMGLPGRDLPRIRFADADSDGDLDLVQAAPGLNRWRFTGSRPVMRADLSELGSRTQITYGTSAGNHTLMPAGMVVNPVTQLDVFDGRSTQPVETTRYTHKRAYFAFQERQFLGFETRDVQRARGTDTDSFWLDRRCGAQIYRTEIRTSSNRVLSSVLYDYRGSSAPEEPTVCLPWAQTALECEGASGRDCRKIRSEFTYDLYGNRVRVVDKGDASDPADDRMEETVVVPNDRDYIVDRTASVTRSQAELDAHGRWGWRLLSENHYVYDDNTDYLQPPSRGLVAERDDWDDRQGRFLATMFRHDGRGNLSQTNGPPTPHAPGGYVENWKYDCTYEQYPVSSCNAVGCTDTVWDLDHVRATTVFDANFVATGYQYDALGRRTQVDAPGGRFERTVYAAPSTWGALDQHTTVERSDGSSDGKLTSMQYFDGLGRTYRTWAEGDTSVTQEFDGASARVSGISVPKVGPGTPTLWTRTTFDAANRPLRVTLPDGRVRTTAYGVGTVTQTNERGAKTIAHVDGQGRISAIEELLRMCPYANPEQCADTRRFVTRYGYDGADHLTWIIDDVGNVTQSIYDSLGRRLWHSSPDGGDEVVTYADDGKPRSFTDITGAHRDVIYDRAGRPVVRETYDAAGNMTRRAEYTWDVDPRTQLPRGASIGRLVDELDSGDVTYTKELTWSPNGEITHVYECTDRNCVEHERAYDVAGRIDSITYPDGAGGLSSASEVVHYDYREDGRLARIPGYLDDIAYDEFGTPMKLSFSNGVTEERERDPRRGWLDRVVVSGRAGRLIDVTVGRDPTGSVDTLTTAGLGYSVHETYERDDLGRLLTIDSSDPSSSSKHEYDSIGRMTYDSRRGRVDYGDRRHVHAMTDASNGDAYKYDDRGQLVADLQRDLGWNPDGQLVEVQQPATRAWARFAYAADGARLASTDDNGTTYTFGNLLEVDPRDGVVTNIVAFDRTLARKDAHGAVEFLHTDHLGSVRAITDDRGDLVQETDYDVWGRQRYVNGSAHADRGFTGARSSEDVGLVHMGARYYDHALAEMISPDTIIPDPFTPQTLNPYAFVMNDPATLTDPTGHDPEDEWQAWLPVYSFFDRLQRTKPPGPQCLVQGFTMEEWQARQDLNAGATPEERAARESMDAQDRFERDVVFPYIVKPMFTLGRLASIIDPSPVADIAFDWADEHVGGGNPLVEQAWDSTEFAGGRGFLTVASVLTPSPGDAYKIAKFFTAAKDVRTFKGVLKIRIPLAALQQGEKRLIQQKYGTANRLIREGTIDARIGTRIPYSRRQSREFVKLHDDLPGSLDKIRVPKGWNVDEFVSRAHGGPQLLFNQHYLPDLLNQSIGGWEQAAERAMSVKDGDQILRYFVEFY